MNQLFITGEGNVRYPRIYPPETINKKISSKNQKPERQLFKPKTVIWSRSFTREVRLLVEIPFQTPSLGKAAYKLAHHGKMMNLSLEVMRFPFAPPKY